MKPLGIAAALFFTIVPGETAAQPPPSQRSFEVASVKTSVGRVMPAFSTSGPNFRADAKSLFPLLIYAFHMRSYQVVRASGDGFDLERYDIVARAPGSAIPSAADFREMMQTLLRDRFRMRYHREQRQMQVYGLQIGPKGIRFQESAAETEPGRKYEADGRNYRVTLTAASTNELLDAIENSLIDRPVVDETGLGGAYDIKLNYTPDTKANRATDNEPDYISIFTAVETQLGLKLVLKKATVDTLVIDSFEKPSAN